jgi:inosose dehydratase
MARPFGCAAIVHNPDTLPKGAAKSQSELDIQAGALNRLGKALAAEGFQLRLHHHGVELENQAREVRHYLAHTDPKLVTFCMDVEFVYRSNMSPPAFIEEIGPRVTELHLRNRTNNSPLQSFEAGDIDYGAVARTLEKLKLKPLIVVELAYHDDTVITRSFPDNVRLSRLYASKLFRL